MLQLQLLPVMPCAQFVQHRRLSLLQQLIISRLCSILLSDCRSWSIKCEFGAISCLHAEMAADLHPGFRVASKMPQQYYP